jgi:hypothetical protein
LRPETAPSNRPDAAVRDRTPNIAPHKRPVMRLFLPKSQRPPNRRTAWWAREDSNLQPDRYERPALTIELRALASAAQAAADARSPIQCRAGPDNRGGAGGLGGRPDPRATRLACGQAGTHARGGDRKGAGEPARHQAAFGPQPDSVMHVGSESRWAPKLPGAERGTVNGMLPDFRFVLGAMLAIALLAVAGLGLVTSVQLVREAHMGPLEDQRSLAFAGHAAERNPFYDPDSARRFEGLAGKIDGPVAPARLETPAETSPVAPIIAPSIAPLSPEERTASIPTHPLDPDFAPDIVRGKTPESDPPHLDPPQLPDTPAPVMIAAPHAEAADPPAPAATGSGAPLADRVASLPPTSPGAPLPQEAPAPAQPQAAGDRPQGSLPPAPRPRPKPQFHRRIARAHIRRIDVAGPQTLPNSGFAPWQGYDNQFTGTTTKKTAGKLTGTPANRPQ